MTSPAAGGVQPPAELRLAPRAESVRLARRFLRELLRASDREQWADAAELALSEVVTNGVLHAHTELLVRVQVLGDLVEVEVSDGNPSLPVQRRGHDEQATTGRGLELVSALTRDCGVRPEPPGKIVWFVVGDEPSEEPSEDELLASWDADDGWDVEGGWGRPERLDAQEVVLRGMPTTLWVAAREHHQAMLRELVLYLAEHDDDGVGGGRTPDLALADEARQLIWTALVEHLDLPEVPRSVDLSLRVPPRLGRAFGALQDALDKGERLAVRDRLLVRPALPEIIAVRDWACEQVVAQLAGVHPSPWPGADQPFFTELVHDRDRLQQPPWDPSVVTASERGVVAADDANRILAISGSLAQELGWTPGEIVGRRVVALIPPELREAHVAGFTRHLTTGQAHLLDASVELPVLRRDGSRVTCSFRLERAEAGGDRSVYLAWIEPLGAQPG